MLVLFFVCTYSPFAVSVSVSRSPLGQRSRWSSSLISAKSMKGPKIDFFLLSGLVRRPAVLRLLLCANIVAALAALFAETALRTCYTLIYSRRLRELLQGRRPTPPSRSKQLFLACLRNGPLAGSPQLGGADSFSLFF